MSTNRFPHIGYTTIGRDHNFYEKADVTWTGFGSNSTDGYQPDMIVQFSTTGAIFVNEGTGTVEYSFNGTTVHGELVGATTSPTRTLTFLNRGISKIWFRVKSGSSGPLTVSVQAW